MSKNIFISYSHKDEQYKDDLIEHLALLKRNKIVDIWHDRKIMPGDEWKDEIDSNLSSAEIIIILVSQSFIASDYCYDVELKKALEMHENQEAILIPIIVRSCDFGSSVFSHLQALPKDAKAINTWSDKDSVWCDTIKLIKEKIINFTPIEKTKTNSLELVVNNLIIPNNLFSEWCNDTEIDLKHRKLANIKLDDIYIYPDIEVIGQNAERDLISKSKKLLNKKGKYIIQGEEQQGKTALLKMMYKNFIVDGKFPLFLNGMKITKSNIKVNIEKALKQQYENISYNEFMLKDEKIIILDDINKIKLNEEYRNYFLHEIDSKFDWIIITCNDSFSYLISEIEVLYKYSECKLLSFGHVRREEIVSRWVCLGVEESINDKEHYAQCDELKEHLNTVIKENIVPPKPIYILMLLQMFEVYSKKHSELTSYGHCYQQLIYQSLDNAKIHQRDIEKYINVLTEISWSIFKCEHDLNPTEIESFFEEYSQKYLSVDKDVVLNKLLSHSILVNSNECIGFKYPYIYYFFVGKKIAESFTMNDDFKSVIDDLLLYLHREDYANIIIFITHHTKDVLIFSKIKSFLSSLFESEEKATLAKEQLSFMDDFVKMIPELVIEQREIRKERKEQNSRLDRLERSQSEKDKKFKKQYDTVTLMDSISKAFKGMEIAGQIIRTRNAAMTRDSIFDLANSGLSTGLRFLNFFIHLSDLSKKEVVNLIGDQLYNQPNITNREIQVCVENLYLQMTFSSITGIIKKIADSIGSREAFEIYTQIEQKEPTLAHALIEYTIELQYMKDVNINSLSIVYGKVNQSPVCLRILKEIIVQHIYMFPADYKKKQQIAEIIDVSIKNQRLMDRKTALQR
jgi:hypothetical protein